MKETRCKSMAIGLSKVKLWGKDIRQGQRVVNPSDGVKVMWYVEGRMDKVFERGELAAKRTVDDTLACWSRHDTSRAELGNGWSPIAP